MSLVAGALVLALGREEVQIPVRETVLFVVGPSNHPPGTHEVGAGARLVAASLGRSGNVSGLATQVVEGWPRGEGAFEGVKSVVFFGDLFPPEVLPDSKRVMEELGGLMDKGVGIVCVHYATGVTGDKVGADGSHPLLRWMGGYFANPGSTHHQSVARIFPAARIEPGAGGHPVTRGWSTFTLEDEPYINNYFGATGREPGPGVLVFATSLLPPESPQRETVAWGIQRADGGRGMGVVMPHFYKNWALEDLRRLVLNGIVWTAGREVPAGGVESPKPDLEEFLKSDGGGD